MSDSYFSEVPKNLKRVKGADLFKQYSSKLTYV